METQRPCCVSHIVCHAFVLHLKCGAEDEKKIINKPQINCLNSALEDKQQQLGCEKKRQR